MGNSIRLHREHGLNPTIAVCFFCGKEKNEIALLGAACKERAPMHSVVDRVPCDECKKFMDMGIMLVEVQDGSDRQNPYRTGKMSVIKEEAAQRIFKSLNGSRFAFVEHSAWEKIGLH
jgi:hypothetical protein